MKFIYTLLFILALSLNISIAQTSKGTQYLGLRVGISGGNTKVINAYSYNESRISLSFDPQYSYFIADQWELGGSVGYSFNQSKVTHLSDLTSTSKYKLNSYSSGLFIRRHILLTEKLALRSGPFATYSFGKENNDPKETDPEYDPNSKSFSTGINLGIEFFPVKRLGISADLADISYHYQKTAGLPDQSTSGHYFDAQLTDQLNLSVFLIF